MTHDAGGRGGSGVRAHIVPALEAGVDALVSLGTFALTKDGSQKRVKDTGELAKMVDTNTP